MYQKISFYNVINALTAKKAEKSSTLLKNE